MIISQNLPTILVAIGTLIFLIAFIIYNKDILKGSTKPSIVSWSLFTLITLINFASYFAMTHDIFKSALALTDLLACAIITILILAKSSRQKLTIIEKFIILFAIFSVIIWVIFQSATFANILLQPAYILSFIPTYIGAIQKKEKALPWLLWSISFILSLTVIYSRSNGNWSDFFSPIVALALHLGVGFVALNRR